MFFILHHQHHELSVPRAKARSRTRRLNVRTVGWFVCAWMVMHTLSACQSQSTATSTSPETASVTINGETFTCELATDPQARDRGMSGRTAFPEDGMLFVFPQPAIQSFWMYECRIDIDLIFLDALGYVTATHEMKTEPLRRENESEAAYRNRLKRYTSGHPAQFAIELPAGSIQRLDVRVEDRVELDRARLKALAE